MADRSYRFAVVPTEIGNGLEPDFNSATEKERRVQ